MVVEIVNRARSRPICHSTYKPPSYLLTNRHLSNRQYKPPSLKPLIQTAISQTAISQTAIHTVTSQTASTNCYLSNRHPNRHPKLPSLKPPSKLPPPKPPSILPPPKPLSYTDISQLETVISQTAIRRRL